MLRNQSRSRLRKDRSQLKHFSVHMHPLLCVLRVSGLGLITLIARDASAWYRSASSRRENSRLHLKYSHSGKSQASSVRGFREQSYW
jgi:hypothetical protein